MAITDKEILKVLKEMSKKLDSAKPGAAQAGGPQLKEISADDDEETKAAKIAQNKILTQEANKQNALILEKLRLEAEVNTVLLDRQAKMDALVQLDKEKSRIEQEIALNRDNAEVSKKLQEELDKVDKLLDANKKLLVQAKNQTNAQKAARKAGVDLFGSLAGAIGIATRAQDTYLGKLFKTINVLKEPGGITAFFKGIAQGIGSMVFGFIDSVIKHTIDMIFALDEAQNKFSAATAMGDKYNAMISSATFANVEFGISAQETGAAAQAMHANFFAFTQVSEETQKQIVTLTSKLERLGVASNDMAGLMNFFNKNVGQTTEQSAESAAQLALMGRNIGITAGKMSKDFLAAAPKLAVYGQRAVEIFGNIAAAAHRAGVSTTSLIGVADKFDTFSSAAETVGKLNAILGSQMSATEMLMMTEDQRIETLILQVQASGMAFRDMDRFTQKAIAAAAGINDMNEAQRIFGMSLGSYQDAQQAMAKEAKAQEEVDKAVKAALPAKQKLLIFFNKFISKTITDEFIQKMHNFLDQLLKFADYIMPKVEPAIKRTIEFFKEWGPTIGKVVMAIAGLSLAYLGFKVIVAPIIGIMKGLKSITGLFGKATKAATGGLKKQGIQMPKNQAQMQMYSKTMRLNTAAQNANARAAGFGALKIAAVGAALLLAGIGIYIATSGIASLAESMKGMGAEAGYLMGIVISLSVAFLGAAIALSFLGGASAAAAGPILAVGVAILLMGVGIGIAAAGIGFMAIGLSQLGPEGLNAAIVIAMIAGASYVLAGGLGTASISFTLFGGAAAFATPTLIAIGLAIAGVTLAIAFLLTKVTTMFKTMTDFGNAIRGTSQDTKSLAFALSSLAGAAIMGNLGIPYLKAATALAKAKKTTINFTGVGKMADKVIEASESMATLTTAGAQLSEIAQGITEIDTAMGEGKKRVEIVSTLGAIAKISTQEAGGSVAALRTTAQARQDQVVKFNIKNEFKDLQLVIKDGKKLETFIRETTNNNRSGQTTAIL